MFKFWQSITQPRAQPGHFPLDDMEQMAPASLNQTPGTFHLLITAFISYMLHVATNGVTHGVSSKQPCDNISILFAATFARVYSCILRNQICTNGNLLQQPISERTIAVRSPLSLPVMLEYSLGHNNDVLLGPTAANDPQSTPSAPHGTDAVTPSRTETNLPPPLVIPTTTGRKLFAIDRSALRDMPTNTSSEVVQLNPKQQGSASRAQHENFKHSTTVAEYIDTSNGFADFFHDYTKGYVKILMHAVMSVLSNMFTLPLTIPLSPAYMVFGIHRPLARTSSPDTNASGAVCAYHVQEMHSEMNDSLTYAEYMHSMPEVSLFLPLPSENCRPSPHMPKIIPCESPYAPCQDIPPKMFDFSSPTASESEGQSESGKLSSTPGATWHINYIPFYASVSMLACQQYFNSGQQLSL